MTGPIFSLLSTRDAAPGGSPASPARSCLSLALAGSLHPLQQQLGMLIRKRGLLPPHQGWDHLLPPAPRFLGGSASSGNRTTTWVGAGQSACLPEPHAARAPGLCECRWLHCGILPFWCRFTSGHHPSVPVPAFYRCFHRHRCAGGQVLLPPVSAGTRGPGLEHIRASDLQSSPCLTFHRVLTRTVRRMDTLAMSCSRRWACDHAEECPGPCRLGSTG